MATMLRYRRFVESGWRTRSAGVALLAAATLAHSSCTRSQPAPSDAWRATRSTADTTLIARVYDRLVELRDSSLFETSRTLLVDRTASAESRVFSAMLLVTQLVEHADPSYGVYATTGPHDVCTIGSTNDRALRVGTPLPSNASELAQTAALRVMTSESDPSIVKNAARCMYEALQRDERVFAQMPPWMGGGALVTESAGRLDTGRVRPAADTRPRVRAKRRPRLRASTDSVPAMVVVAHASECLSRDGHRVHEGVLRRSPRGDVLETRDGRRLPVANLPRSLGSADGVQLWIAEPLGAPTSAGIIDPNDRSRCGE